MSDNKFIIKYLNNEIARYDNTLSTYNYKAEVSTRKIDEAVLKTLNTIKNMIEDEDNYESAMKEEDIVVAVFENGFLDQNFSGNDKNLVMNFGYVLRDAVNNKCLEDFNSILKDFFIEQKDMLQNTFTTKQEFTSCDAEEFLLKIKLDLNSWLRKNEM